MTLISAAAAAALDAPPDANDNTLNRYGTRIEFPVKESLSNAPNLLQKLRATLVDTTPGILFYTASNEKIDVENFPKEKLQFDHVFGTIVTEQRNQRLVVGFEILSAVSFHTIKKSVWHLLTKHGIYMKKHPGPLQKIDLITLGHLHQARPTYASPSSLQEEVMTSMCEQIGTLSAAKLEALQIPNDGKFPNLFVSPGKIHGTYQNTAISSNVMYLQAEHSDAPLLRILLENCYVNQPLVFVPLSLKHENPELFGTFLCHQNHFLENNRNFALVRLSSEAMDYDENPACSYADENPAKTSNALWNVIQTIPGISRLDSYRRTFDLGQVEYHHF
jgi:hypothetical protein